MLSDKFGDRKACLKEIGFLKDSFRVWAGISGISVGFMAFEEGRKWDPVIQKKKTLLTNCSFDVENQITDDSKR